MSPLERNIIDKIKSGSDTFAVLSLLVPAAEARLVDSALQRLRRQGLLKFNRIKRTWEVLPSQEPPR